jgi:hypothetical protein
MAEGDNYLARALELLRRAEKGTDPEKRKALETLAEDYREQAEKPHHTGLTVEFDPEIRGAPSMSALGLLGL